MAQTVSEAMIAGTMGDLNQMPAESLPWHADMMQSIPTLPAVMGTKAFRGSGTILKGGSRVGAGSNVGRTGWGATREGLRQANYLNPRNWSRFGSQGYFHHTGALTRAGTPAAAGAAATARTTGYNPFYMAAGANWMGRQMTGEGTGRVGQFLANTKASEWMQKKGLLAPGSEMISKGFYSRVSAAGRLGWMSESRAMGGRVGRSTEQFLRGAGLGQDAISSIRASGPGAVRGALLMSGTGTLSGRVGGFIAGAGTGTPVDRNILRGFNRPAQKGFFQAQRMGRSIGLAPGTQFTARQAVGAGMRTGGVKAIGKGVALAGARVAGLSVPGLNVAMAAWLAYDLAKLATKGAGYAGQIAADGYKSLRGDLNKGIMEGGFRDTEATMTSRSRGVQAIQNSRLNARSILGSEAGAMHSHFG